MKCSFEIFRETRGLKPEHRFFGKNMEIHPEKAAIFLVFQLLVFDCVYG